MLILEFFPFFDRIQSMPAEQSKINFTKVKRELFKERQGLSVYIDQLAINNHLRETLRGDGIPIDTVENSTWRLLCS